MLTALPLQNSFIQDMQKRAIFWLLCDDEDDTLELIPYFSKKKRQQVHDIFVHRQSEGSFSILIERYLFSDHQKFTHYLRVSPRTFYTILKHIFKDIYVAPTNRIKNPIDPSQKLCIALR